MTDDNPPYTLESPQRDRAMSAAFDPEREETVQGIGGSVTYRQPKPVEEQQREEIISLRQKLSEKSDQLIKAKRLSIELGMVLENIL